MGTAGCKLNDTLLSILGMYEVNVGVEDVGSGTCLCVLKQKSFLRLRDRRLLAIEGPAFTSC